MAAHAPEDIARTATEAIRAHGRRVLLAGGWASLTPIDDAEDCFAVGEVNQQALFPRVAAVIHHGGAGTTTTAARAGTPQAVLPRIADQHHWAAQVSQLALGASHPAATPTRASLSAALTTALSPETRTRAKAIAATIQTNGATTAAKMLVKGAGLGVDVGV